MILVISTEPAKEPITLDAVKLHLRVDITEDDSRIGRLIQVARETAEEKARRALITQTWDYYLDAWPEGDRLAIPLPPVQSVTYVKFTDSAGGVNTMDAADYVVADKSEPGAIVLATGATWPSETLQVVEGVNIRFMAGYGDEPGDIPESIIQAMLLHIGHLYENREAIFTGRGSPEDLPMGYMDLLRSKIITRW